MIDTKLKNKVALITGANNPYGIGAAIVKALAIQGVKVFLQYYRFHYTNSISIKNDEVSNNEYGEEFYHHLLSKNCDDVLESIKEYGVESFAFESDLSKPENIPIIFDKAEEIFERVDILINNAAYWEADTFIPPNEELKNELVELWSSKPASVNMISIDKIFAVNTRAPVLMIKEFVSRYIKGNLEWGRIVNVSTDGAYCFPSEITYGASKFALEAYSRSAALELGQFGITVNTVSLGAVQTGWINSRLEKEILPSIPLGKIGLPKDVADVIVFLVSDQARWVTGQRIFVGGGHGM
jgi:3-oxoacyl-[acyl-carrier protein] reductase